MNQKAIEKTELNKILLIASEYATLTGGKRRLEQMQPTPSLSEAKKRRKITEECVALLFSYGVSKIEYFPEFTDEMGRAKKGSALSCGELLKIENLLRSTRIAYNSIHTVGDTEIKYMKETAEKLILSLTKRLFP